MRAYMESGFYVIYLALMIGIGCRLTLGAKKNKADLLFGAACLLLGCGDAFHLIPRAVGLFTGTLDAPGKELALWLGVGKLITSITMPAFYFLIYFFIYVRSGAKRVRAADSAVFLLTAARIALCAFPQNGWTVNDSPLAWGIARNIPFTLLGVIVMIAAFRHLRQIKRFRLFTPLVILSFAFYLPVVIWAGTHTWVGMLMLPKTVCYGWIAVSGLLDSKDRAAG